MTSKRCKTGTHKSKTGKSCVTNKPKPKRYRLNFELIYGKPKKKRK